MNVTPEFPVGLDNCEREPIHIPGRIQSHGVLLAFTDRKLSHRSVNAASLLGAAAPVLGQDLMSTFLAVDTDMLEAVNECLRADGGVVQPVALDVTVNGQPFELVCHRLGEHVIAELEQGGAASQGFEDHAFKGHRALSRLKRQQGIGELLQAAVEEVRALTGFDRVMAYRFRHDDSGDVVCEARSEGLEPFAGRRYPAGDIPAQARRLYTINTLRNIADVASPTVAVEAVPQAAGPLDMSHCVMRSVSPIHIEYLTNMGVGASMSISVVVNGRLWGMIACHHMGPRHVPYSVRSVCDVLAQILAANVQTLEAREHARHVADAASVRARAIEHLLHADDGIFSLAPQAEALAGMLGAQALVMAEQGRVAVWGGVAQPAARALVQWLSESGANAPDGRAMPIVQRFTLDGLPDALREALGIWCGMLALRFNDVSQGWVVALRKEQVETIDWGGRPEKEYAHGPLGPRLTPRGSFDVWKETVRGQCVPWDGADLEVAQALLSDLVRASAVRGAELDRARSHLLGMLGEGMHSQAQRVAAEAPLAGGRMQRLVSQVLDASRLQGGAGLGLRMEAVDLAVLLNELIDEAVRLYPDTRIIRELPASLPIQADAPRLRQLVYSLLSNARLHGEPGEPVLVQLHRAGGLAVLDVSNVGAEIPAERVDGLFNPFRSTAGAEAVREGLGLSLYIAQHIARAHGGDLGYAYADPYVMFSVTLPAPDAAA